MKRSCLLATFVSSALWSAAAQAPARPIVIASKPFGESYLLAEMFAQVLESKGIAVQRKSGLGGTEVLFAARRRGDIDVYPEYTGTGLVAILHDTASRTETFGYVARRFSQLYDVAWLPPIGFENTYAIAISPATAKKYDVRSLTDLARASPHLTGGFTADFIGRSDGLPGLTKAYGMRFHAVKALSPALKYEALKSGAIDVIDGYSTDGLLARYDFVTLTDDKGFFPPYDASAVVSSYVAHNRPEVMSALTQLSGRIDVTRIRQLNKRVDVDRADVPTVAREARAAVLPSGGARDGPAGVAPSSGLPFARLATLTAQHVWLVFIALLAAIAVAVPIGLALERVTRGAESVLATLGVLQTIPSIALLAFMIPFFGVGVRPALVALWLYALYPIARATYAGVRNADGDAAQAATALGCTPGQVLRWVKVPLAAPIIMSGIRTAAVITVGAATLAAFIGAGGLGEPIVEGLALADTQRVLSGAIPAAILALLIDGLLWLVERRLRPAHLR